MRKIPGKRVNDDITNKREAFQIYACDRLKNPLTAIGLTLQRLDEVKTEEERKRLLAIARKSQREMTEAVEEVLSGIYKQ